MLPCSHTTKNKWRKDIMSENVYEISVGQVFRIALKHWWIILAAALLGAVIAFGYVTLFVTPSYMTFAKVGVNNVQMSSYQDFITGQTIAKESSDILTSNITLEKAAAKLNADPNLSRVYTPDNILAMIRTRTTEQSRYFDVEVYSTDPNEAKIVCQTVVDTFCEVLAEENVMFGGEGKVIHHPVVPKAPSSPNTTLTVIIGVLVGLVISFVVLLVIHFSKDALDGEDWLIDSYKDKIPMLAVIPDANMSGKSYRKYYSKHQYGYLKNN